MLDCTSRKRGLLHKALKESKNLTTEDCEVGASNLSGNAIEEDPILDEVLDQDLSDLKASNLANLQTHSSQKIQPASKIEEHIQILEDSPDKGSQQHGEDDKLIESLPAADQSCEFG